MRLLYACLGMFLLMIGLVSADILLQDNCTTGAGWTTGGTGGFVFSGRCNLVSGGSGIGAQFWRNEDYTITPSSTIYVDFVDFSYSNRRLRSDAFSMGFRTADSVVNKADAILEGMSIGDTSSNGVLYYGGPYASGRTGTTEYLTAANVTFNLTMAFYSNLSMQMFFNGDPVNGSVPFQTAGNISSFQAQFVAYNYGNISFDMFCVRNGSTVFGCVEESAPGDTDPPSYADLTNNASTTTKQNAYFNASVTISDATGISWWWYETNTTGVWANGTKVDAGDVLSIEASALIEAHLTENQTIGTRFWANDTGGYLSGSSFTTFVVAANSSAADPCIPPVSGGWQLSQTCHTGYGLVSGVLGRGDWIYIPNSYYLVADV